MTLVGRTLSHFRILALIGEGGVGEVYEAEDTNLHRRVALKVLSPRAIDSEERRARFLREAHAAAAVSHPNVAIVYEVDEAEGIAFIAMELLSGTTLRTRLQSGPLPLEEAVRIAHDIAAGLAHAHRMNLVHRDLKPENVIVEPDGRVKILDFGLAKIAERTSEPDQTAMLSTPSLAANLTQEGKFLGTWAYASPQQVRGTQVDEKSDIFSFGVVLYELITGTSPFRRPTPIETGSAVMRDNPVPPSQLRREIPGELDRIVAACLIKDSPLQRPSAESLMRDLEPLGLPGAMNAARRKWPWQRLLGAGAAALLLAAGIVGIRELSSRHGKSASPAQTMAQSSVPRRSVAVLGFKDLSASSGASWLSTALAEMLTTELAAGGTLRAISRENVVRMKTDLVVADEASLGEATLARIHEHLGADLVVLGSYVVLDQGADPKIRLDVRLQKATDGETVLAVVHTGTESGLFDLVSFAGAKLRDALGVSAAAAAEAGALTSTIPRKPEAAQLYAQGLEKLSHFEALAARDLLERSIQLEPDRAATHAALAWVWEQLGYNERQQKSAERAFELSAGLPLEARLVIEAGYRQAQRDWKSALEVQGTLWRSFPDNIDYALRLASIQTRSGNAKDALATIDEVRERIPSAAQNPRVDLAEASAASALTDFRRAVLASERAAARATSTGARLLAAQAKLIQGSDLNNLGESDSAMVVLDEARDTFAAAGDRSGNARAIQQLATVLADRGDADAAIQQHELALQVFREIGFKTRIAGSLNNMANVYYNQGNLERAKALYEEALEIDLETKDRTGLPHRLGNIANVLDNQGDLTGAMAMHRRALAAFEEIGHTAGAARTRNNIGLLLLQGGEVIPAQTEFEAAIEAQRAAGSRRDLGYTLDGLGNVLIVRDDLAGARRAWEEALQIREELGDEDTVVEMRLELGKADFEEGRFAEAATAAKGAADFFSKDANDQGRLIALALAMNVHLARGELEEARKKAREASEVAARVQNRANQLDFAIADARVRHAEGETRSAQKILSATIRELNQRGVKFLALEARLAEGEVALGSEDSAGARVRLTELEQEAGKLEFRLIARKCRAALGRK